MITSPDVLPAPTYTETLSQDNQELHQRLNDAFVAMEGLPVVNNREHIQEKLNDPNCRVLLADFEPGTGKSYGLPPILLQSLLTARPDRPNARVIVSEPRRSIVAQLGGKGEGREGPRTLQDMLGEKYVDFSYKGKNARNSSQIEFTVEQRLLKKLIHNDLADVDGIIIDEAHRNMGLLKPLLRDALKRNPHLKVIFATGTADAVRGRLYEMFPEMQEIKVEGRKHEVSMNFAETSSPKEKIVEDAANLTEKIIKDGEEQGNILIFMPGQGEITETERLLLAKNLDIEIVQIMGKTENAQELIDRITGKRKVIIATNALEEGVNPKCDIVIVPGWRRIKRVDPITGIVEWKTVRVAHSSAEQQAKRVGRERIGTAHFLFTKGEFDNADIFPPKDQEDEDLLRDILTLKAAGYPGDLRSLEYEETVNLEYMEAAIQRLKLLGALDQDEHITDIGEEMSEFEEDPRFTRMLIEAKKNNCVDAVALIIAYMKAQGSIYRLRRQNRTYLDSESDQITMLNMWNNREIDVKAMFFLNDERKNILRDLRLRNFEIRDWVQIPVSEQKEAIKRCIAAGLADQLLLKTNENKYTLTNFTSPDLQIDPSSVIVASSPERFLAGILEKLEGSDKILARKNLLYAVEELGNSFPYLKHILQSEISTTTEKSSEQSTQQQQETTETTRTQQSTSSSVTQTEEIRSEELTEDDEDEKPTASLLQRIGTYMKKTANKILSIPKNMYTEVVNFGKKILKFFRRK